MKSVTAFAVIATVGLAFVLPTQAQAATDLFLTWPGIIGTSPVKGHLGDIELVSYTQTASNIPDSTGLEKGAAEQSTPMRSDHHHEASRPYKPSLSRHGAVG